MPKSRARFVGILISLLIIYGAAWTATGTWGRAAVRRHSVQKYAREAGIGLVAAKPPWFEPARLSHNDFHDRPLHGDYVHVSAPYPFVLEVERSEYHGPSSSGETEWYLWFFWWQERIARSDPWVRGTP